MISGKCGTRKLCPVSLGLAIGIVCGLAVLIWALWVVSFGPSMYFTMASTGPIPVTPTAKDAILLALAALVKGFIFGFFVALLYDWISCCCKMRCCRSSCTCCKADCTCKPDCTCKAGCTCKGICNCPCCVGNKPESGKDINMK